MSDKDKALLFLFLMGINLGIKIGIVLAIIFL